MMVFIDNWLPWLGDLLSLGGNILGLILVMAFMLWSLLLERYYTCSGSTRTSGWRHRPGRDPSGRGSFDAGGGGRRDRRRFRPAPPAASTFAPVNTESDDSASPNRGPAVTPR